METRQIRVIIVKGEHSWIAQALDVDIAAQGATIKDVMTAWVKTMLCELQCSIRQGKHPFEDVPKAPQRFFELWNLAELSPVEVPRPIDFADRDVPPAWMINQIVTQARAYVT